MTEKLYVVPDTEVRPGTRESAKSWTVAPLAG
jgi:hypothetical protein